jgi:integrase
LRQYLRQCYRMKRAATDCNTGSRSNSRHYSYTKVLDNGKHPIRGLWRRNGRFLARITVEGATGKKAVKWVPLESATVAEAREQFRKLLVERDENQLRHIGQAPKFSDYVADNYLRHLASSGKKPDTIVCEKVHLKGWQEALGHLNLDKIRPHHVTAHLQKLKEQGKANRTRNLSLVVLRNVLKNARTDGFLKTLPVEGIGWQKTEKKSRRLFSREDIDRFCEAGLTASKNGREFSDYVRLLSLCGAREQEAIKLRWVNVDFEQKLLTIGWDGDTKNREARHVDLNPPLESHLREMFSRRAPDSQWMFPSPQRGDKDERAKTFRESLLLARKSQGLPDHLTKFGFHDCRHHFISFGVMSGIDFMTIARWVGHKDGGVLIGKVYGHLSNEHAQAQAARLSFGPAIVSPMKAATA